MEHRERNKNFFIGRAVSDLRMSEPEFPFTLPPANTVVDAPYLNVRLWHLADIAVSSAHDRFWTQSGHYRGCANCCQCGHGPGNLAISLAGIVAGIPVFEA